MMKYQVYRDTTRQWRWRLRAANWQIIAVSGEGYVNYSDCLHAITLVKQSYNARVESV